MSKLDAPTVGLETGCVGTGPPRKNLMTSHQPTGDCEDQYSRAGLGWAGLGWAATLDLVTIAEVRFSLPGLSSVPCFIGGSV